MVQAARETDQVATETRADQKARMEDEIARATLMILAGAIIAVIFGLLMAVLITFSITGAMKKGVEFARSIAAGDLTADLDIDQKDEIGVLAGALREMVFKLRDIVGEVNSAARNVAAGSEELSSTAQEMSQGATEQAASGEEVSSSMEQMGSNIKQNASASEQMASTSEELSGQAEQMQSTMEFFKVDGSGGELKRKMLPGPHAPKQEPKKAEHKEKGKRVEHTGIALHPGRAHRPVQG